MATPLDQLMLQQQAAAPAPAQQYNYTPSAGGFNAPAAYAPSTYGKNLANPDTMVQNSMESFLSPNSSYIQNARRRGAEFAQQRGGINSSIAAGASERSAVEAAQPFIQESLDIQKSREGAQTQNWLSEQNFNRELQGQMTLMPLGTSLDMLSAVQDYALRDPALFTPEVISGYSNFFNENMKNTMGNYFKGLGR